MPLIAPRTENPRWAPRTKTTVIPATPIPAIDPNAAPKRPTPPPAQPTLPVESTKGTDLKFGENQSVTACPFNDAIHFGLTASLRRRKVYGWLWVNPSNAADYFAKCEVEFWRNYSKVGSLWLSAGLSGAVGTMNETIPSAFVSGGVAMPDSLAIYVAQPTGTQQTAYVLQPQYILIEADRVSVTYRQNLNVTGIRLWLGVISSEP